MAAAFLLGLLLTAPLWQWPVRLAARWRRHA
jgi:hypothetical protein